jgi:LPXTG-motif cell wall-anchored protein
MSGETRNNLIFLVGLLILMAPGAIILFNKKSEPGARPVGAPDPVRTTTAYMDPYPADSVERLAPLRTLQWVDELAVADLPGELGSRIAHPVPSTAPTLLAPKFKGSGNVGAAGGFKEILLGPVAAQVISEGRWFQAVSRGTRPDGSTWFRLIIWDEDADPARGKLTAEADGSPVELASAKVIAMPREIRHNLQDAGLVLPPERVTVVDVIAPAPTRQLTLAFDGRHDRRAALLLP